MLHKLEYDIRQWERSSISEIEIAARLHHRLVWIHPFEGGNGRLARLAANIYLRKRGQAIIEWPQDEMIIRARLRKEYIKVLRAADLGDFKNLLKFHKRFWSKNK